MIECHEVLVGQRNGNGFTTPLYEHLILRATKRLKIGLYLPAGELFSMRGTPRWDDIFAMARDAEALGFDSVWILDHQLIESDTPGWEGFEHGAWLGGSGT